MLNQITPVILTFNEAPNIARTLGQLSWARDIVVIDSGSSDQTREIAASYPHVRVFERPFTTHAEQWTFGLAQTAIATDWVLALDADFVLSNELVDEIARLTPAAPTAGYRASFRYCIDGRPLRGAAYPPVVVLYRRTHATYLQDGHTQRVAVRGDIQPLAATVFHDDRKPLRHWLLSQIRYQGLEAEKLTGVPTSSLGVLDRVRRLIVIAPPAMFCYCYFVRGGWLDGTHGLYYALQRTAAELILSLNLVERLLGLHDRDRPTP